MPRRQHKYHFIYKTTCLLNGKFYIGMHSTSNMNDGYMGSGLKIRRSLNKHGIANHKIEHLEFFNNRIELKQREAELVNESLLQDPLCMNLKVGGEGGWEHLKDKKWKRNTGPATLRSKELWKDENWVNALHTKWIVSYRQTILNRKTDNGNGHKGLFHSHETRQKISESMKNKQSGENNSQFGTCWIYSNELKQSKKVKRKDVDSFLLKGWRLGRKNKF